MKKVIALIIGLFTVLAIGCAGNVSSTKIAPGETTPAENKLKNTSWEIVSYGAKDDQKVLKNDKSRSGFDPGFEFSDKGFGGRVAGCNIISSDYTLEGSKISTTNLATTVMGCDPEILQHEQALMKAFETLQEYRIDGDQLELVYQNSQVIRARRKQTEGQTK